ncbi:MAG: radical SAM protein [Holdemanella sp.]|nr:radical SAM protein [Holdemanella sp.]
MDHHQIEKKIVMNRKIIEYKSSRLDAYAKIRTNLYEKPKLRQLFLELTLRCNEHCFHCGSKCDGSYEDHVSFDEYKQLIDEVKENFGCKDILFCITGGEPLLRKDFFEIVDYIHTSGFKWGMTTNGTLITKEISRKLKEAGMSTVSISIDGLEQTHDRQRGLKGGYKKAMEGIQNLIDEDCFEAIQVTTVFNHSNMHEMDELYNIFLNMDIDSWRVIGIEPIGRALEHEDLLLTPDDQRKLFSFIKSKREENMPICYGCSHYLGLEYERDVRDWYFLCGAGTFVASIDADGDIRACLDIEKSDSTIQGNIKKDSFTDIWNNKFTLFRKNLSVMCESCKGCTHEKWCAGGSHHSYDYDKNEQRICFKDILF